MRNASTDQLRDKARRIAAWCTLRDAGLEAVFGGITTVEEVIRETILEG